MSDALPEHTDLFVSAHNTNTSKASSTRINFLFTKSNMSNSKIKEKTLGVVHYLIQNVPGDGHCFFRALYQILQDADVATQRAVDIHHLHDEDEGVAHLRSFVADGLRSGSYVEILNTIDTLCFLASDHVEGTKTRKRRKVEHQEQTQRAERKREPALMSQLQEMYPFISEDVCAVQGKDRYVRVASMVEDVREAMYASGMEIDLVKAALIPHQITLLTISANGPMRTAEKGWSRDLGLLLENAQTKYVAVLLNRNNVHYKYLEFKAPNDNRYHAIVNRDYLLRLIRMNEILEKTEKMVLKSGGKKQSVKQKGGQ